MAGSLRHVRTGLRILPYAYSFPTLRAGIEFCPAPNKQVAQTFLSVFLYALRQEEVVPKGINRLREESPTCVEDDVAISLFVIMMRLPRNEIATPSLPVRTGISARNDEKRDSCVANETYVNH